MSDFEKGMRIRGDLETANQQHLLQFYNQLEKEEKETLENDLKNLEIDNLDQMFKAAQAYTPPDASGLSSVAANRTGKSSDPDNTKWTERGLELVRKSELAVILLAGGQGTRLGSSNPKGMYNVGLPSQKSLFQIQCERLLRVQAMAGSGRIPLYVMTSGPTREKTENFFRANNFFGLADGQIKIFNQGTLPCFNFDGKVLLSSKSSIARAPDGNGGIYSAIKREGILTHMNQIGVSCCHVYCVDNSLVKVADPTFVGFCSSLDADCGNKSVVKTEPTEAVGVVVKNAEGKHCVVEYSELSKESSELRDADGQLTFRAGNICNHFMTLQFLQKIAHLPLPYHIAKKKIPTVDLKSGEAIKPDSPNGIKLEKFIFDVFAYSENFCLFEVDRIDEFSPLKNSDTAKKDCPMSCRWNVMNMNHRHLIEAGAKIEIDGVAVEMPTRPEKQYPENYPFEIEIASTRSYAGENLEEFNGKVLVPPIIIN